ncbi:MAG: ABC transporter permease [Oscillospiraceae bacterium]|jgi:ABC-2 type transport system permease protein|nr:ABC transporter permease [Oscillospiraceae bacterium]
MKSKTSYFNKALFLSQLNRFWPLYTAYFVIWLLIVPVALNTRLSLAFTPRDIIYATSTTGAYLLRAGYVGGMFMSAIFGIFFAMAAFHWLYTGRGVSLMASAPVKREGLFISVFTPGLVFMLLSNIIMFLLALAVGAAYGLALIGYAAQMLAMMCLLNLFFYGFACLCAMLTGHILVLPAIYAILNFTAVVFLSLLYNMLDRFSYGLYSNALESNSAFTSFSPAAHLILRTSVPAVITKDLAGIEKVTGASYTGWNYLFVLGAVGLVMAFLALLLLRRRRMESAGDVVAVRPLRPVFKYCLTIGCAVVLGICLYEIIYDRTLTSVAAYYICAFAAVGAFVGYFAGEMLLEKTLRVFSGANFKKWGLVAALCVGLILAMDFDLFGFERRVPELSEIDNVYLSDIGEATQLNEPEEIEFVRQLHASIISHKALNENPNYDDGVVAVRFDYELKNGSHVQRRYTLNIDASDDAQALQDFLNTPEMILRRKLPERPVAKENMDTGWVEFYNLEKHEYESIEITQEQAYELYTECILPDMQDGNIGQAWILRTDDKEYTQFFYDLHISLSFSWLRDALESQPGDTKSLVLDPLGNERFVWGLNVNATLDSARTNAWLRENLDIEPVTREVSEGDMQARMYSATDFEYK